MGNRFVLALGLGLATLLPGKAFGIEHFAFGLTSGTGFDVYRTQPYFYDEERFVIADVGVHVLDVARFLLGDVQRISCETQRRNPKVRAEDTATMLLRHESGAVSTVEVTYEARRSDDAFPETLMEIEGPRGSIVVTAGCRMKLTSDGEAELFVRPFVTGS